MREFAEENEMNQGAVPLWVSEPQGETIARVLPHFETDQRFELKKFTDADALVQEVRNSSRGILLLSASEREQFVKYYLLIRDLKDLERAGHLKIVLTTPVSDPSLHQKFLAQGCTDVLLEPISDRAFAFKINRFERSIRRLLELEEKNKVELTLKSIEAPSSGGQAPSEEPILESYSDRVKEALRELGFEKEPATLEIEPNEEIVFSNPVLGPLAIAFLVAELISKKEMEATEILNRYCEYLSKACPGLDVSVWLKEGDSVVRKSDPPPRRSSIYVELAKEREQVESLGRANQKAHILSTESMAAPIILDAAHCGGYVVFSGPGSHQLSDQYAYMTSQLLKGVLQAF